MVGRSLSPAIENKVFVKGFNEDVEESAIEKAFTKYGHIVQIYLARDHETKLARGFAFITFDNNSECEDAVKGMDGKEFQGKILHVEKSVKPRGPPQGRNFRGGYSFRGSRDFNPRNGGGRGRDSFNRSRTGRDDQGSFGRNRRPYNNNRGSSRGGGRGRAYSPLPPRDYDYMPPPRSPPRLDRYYESEVARIGKYLRDTLEAVPYLSGKPIQEHKGRYEIGDDMDYRISSRNRRNYSPPLPPPLPILSSSTSSRREYESSRAPLPYSSATSRDYLEYTSNGGRRSYSPLPSGPLSRRDYDLHAGSSKNYGGSGVGSRDQSSYHSSTNRLESGYSRPSPPPLVPQAALSSRHIPSSSMREYSSKDYQSMSSRDYSGSRGDYVGGSSKDYSSSNKDHLSGSKDYLGSKDYGISSKDYGSKDYGASGKDYGSKDYGASGKDYGVNSKEYISAAKGYSSSSKSYGGSNVKDYGSSSGGREHLSVRTDYSSTTSREPRDLRGHGVSVRDVGGAIRRGALRSESPPPQPTKRIKSTLEDIQTPYDPRTRSPLPQQSSRRGQVSSSRRY